MSDYQDEPSVKIVVQRDEEEELRLKLDVAEANLNRSVKISEELLDKLSKRRRTLATQLVAVSAFGTAAVSILAAAGAGFLPCLAAVGIIVGIYATAKSVD